MKTRCRIDGPEHKNYAARDITITPEWSDFSSFLADMGECPEGLTLDRIDNDKGYSAANCRWADMSVQRENQRRVSWVSLNGKTLTVKQAAELIGVSDAAIWNDKRRNGVSLQDAVDRVAARN